MDAAALYSSRGGLLGVEILSELVQGLIPKTPSAVNKDVTGL